MKYVDRYSNFDNLAVDSEIAAILRASVFNQQLFDDPDVDPTYTTQSIKYTRKEKPRADYRKISEIQGDYDVDYREILEFLNYGDTALEFQLDSWQTLHEMDQSAGETGRDQGLIVSAPTGFGKTACFFGYVLNQLLSKINSQKVGADQSTHGDAAIFVYPSRALLHDQLSRVMELFHEVKLEGGETPTFGFWYGNQPRNARQAQSTSCSTAVRRQGGTAFTGATYWDGEVNDQSLYIAEDEQRSYVIENHAGEELFDSTEFYIGRQEIKNRQPNLILTTLESLENISMKPHYNLVNVADYFVFDEIHQYSGLRGSHAANIIHNLKRVRHTEAGSGTSPALFIGSSATIQDPGRFGRELFGLAPNSETPADNSHEYTQGDLQVVTPGSSDIDEENSDKQHYYFMLTNENDEGPDVSSQFLQHAMMVGHSLLREANEDEVGEDRSNILTFVDSKSLLRNLDTKLVDADQINELYKYHFGHGESGDWERLAAETGHIAQKEEPLTDPLPVYSGSVHSINEIPDHDVTLGTKYLEVGVDIETLGYIINYREPESVAALKQRAGRAARKEGDAHMFNLLSSYSGDTNFYYRADGFVNQDISTPIRTDNHVVDTIHDWFHIYYQELSKVDKWTNNEQKVLENFFERMDWDEYNEFLQSPGVCFNRLVDIDVYSNSLLNDSLTKVTRPLREEIEEIEDYFDEFQDILETDAGKVFLQEDAVEDLLTSFRRKLVDQIDGLIEIAKMSDEDDLENELASFKQGVLTVDLSKPHNAANELNSEINDSMGLLGKVGNLSQSTLSDDNLRSRIFDLSERIGDIVAGLDGGKIQEYNRKRRIGYYLRKSLEEIEEYKLVNYRWGSLYAVKYLLRGAYYYEKALRVSSQQEQSEADAVMGDIWYVPPNYFADTGWYFDLVQPNDDETQESIDKLLTQYLPSRTEYASSQGEYGDPKAMNVFQPEVVRSEDGSLEFNFSELGEVHNGVLVPDRIELKRVLDESGNRGNKIVPYDAGTFEVLSPEEVKIAEDRDVEYGQVYATPQIATQVNDPTEIIHDMDQSRDLLELRSMNAQAWIQAVDLEITQSKEVGGRIYPAYDEPTLEETISSGDQRIGYSLNTRGLTLNIGSLVDRFRNKSGQVDLNRNQIPQHKDLGLIDNEQIISYTAAHLLTMLVADVAGVNTQVLLYGTDRPADDTDTEEFKVHTFEQIEGGQGVTDLFWETLESRPEEVLSSLYQLTRNAQVLNEKLWAAGPSDRGGEPAWQMLLTQLNTERLANDDPDVREEEREKAGELITEYLGYSYKQTLERVTDELEVTLNHIEQLSNENKSVTQEELAELKADLAKARIKNEDQNDGEEIPARIYKKFDVFEEVEADVIRRVLMSPDIDGCEANLHLSRTIFSQPQSEILSDGVLQEIEDWVVEKVPAEDEIEEMERTSKLSAYTDEKHAYFLEF